MTYIDGFMAAVPAANRAAYRKHAEMAAPVFKDHGALKMVECWGGRPGRKPYFLPDGRPEKGRRDGCLLLDRVAVKTGPRRGMKKVMADPRIQPNANPMPFDGKRLIFGGFEVLLEA
jgi:uncharacterized protein YbaA (DUF1428 family)